jgi:hypothetical protein
VNRGMNAKDLELGLKIFSSFKKAKHRHRPQRNSLSSFGRRAKLIVISSYTCLRIYIYVQRVLREASFNLRALLLVKSQLRARYTGSLRPHTLVAKGRSNLSTLLCAKSRQYSYFCTSKASKLSTCIYRLELDELPRVKQVNRAPLY